MRKILVVVDMQKDFIDGALGTIEARTIVDPVVEVMMQYPPENIFATRDTHPENYLETQEGRHLPVVHCIKGTPGWELDPQIQQALRGAEVVDKPTFGSKTLADKIASIAVADDIEVTLVGLCTDICVISNALLIKAYMPEVPVKVIASCCAGVTPQSHQEALNTMRMCQVEIV